MSFISKELRKELMRMHGYKLAREYTIDPSTVTEDPHTARPFPHRYPDDRPDKKNYLVLVPFDDPLRSSEQRYATSTRGVVIAQEMRGGEMRDRFGVVCAIDDRGRSQFVIGGGMVQPDFSSGNDDRLHPGEDRELVRGGVVAECREELAINFFPTPLESQSDTEAYPKYLLFGVRDITDKIEDPETGAISYVPKRHEEDGLICVDACFLAITRERLGNFNGQRGETRTRYVMPASKLLRQLSREERERNVLPMLPAAQAHCLAQAIIIAKEMFGNKAPESLKEVIEDGEEDARRVISRSPYAKHFTKVVQEMEWEP